MPAKTRAEANAQQRKWYQSHREEQIARVRRGESRRKDWYAALKKTLSCPCGESDPRCLEFHHRDPKTKRFNVSDFHRRTWTALKAEIDKCDVMCANCHRKVTLPATNFTGKNAVQSPHGRRAAGPSQAGDGQERT